MGCPSAFSTWGGVTTWIYHTKQSKHTLHSHWYAAYSGALIEGNLAYLNRTQKTVCSTCTQCIPELKAWKLPVITSVIKGEVYNWTGRLDWTIGLDNWTGRLDRTSGLDKWTGWLDWTIGLDGWMGVSETQNIELQPQVKLLWTLLTRHTQLPSSKLNAGSPATAINTSGVIEELRTIGKSCIRPQ